MKNENEVIQIPLIAKENSDKRFIHIIKWLIAIIIISNLLWLGSWAVYWFSPDELQSSYNISQDSQDEAQNSVGDINK